MTRDQFIEALKELFEHDGKIHVGDIADVAETHGGLKVTMVEGDTFDLVISRE